MKTIVLSLCLTSLAFCGLVSLTAHCPDQYVPNSNNICIRPEYLEGCDIYKNIYECDTCIQGYEKTNGKCTLNIESAQITASLIGCLTFEGQVCTNCANGYRLQEGACVDGVKYCEDYDNEGQCKKCDNEYSLIFGECRHNILLGCKVEQDDHTCLECFKPFQLENYQCVIPACKSYNDYGCYACECGFYITNTHSCQKMQDGCVKTYRGTCVECLPHYKLKGGACAIEGCLESSDAVCSVCKSDYDLIDGICQFKNCYDWKDDTCLICKEGYNLLAGKCVQSGPKFVCEG